MRQFINRLLILGLLLVAPTPSRRASALRLSGEYEIAHRAEASPSVSFSLDGVQLDLWSSFLSEWAPVVSDPNSAIQMATAVDREPVHKQLSVVAVPFETRPPTEGLPPAGPGGAPDYRAALRAFRENQRDRVGDGPVVSLFGQGILGTVSVVTLPVRGEPRSVGIGEWVVEAGPRLWIVRASQVLEMDGGQVRPIATLSTALSDLRLTSPDVNRPSASRAAGFGTEHLDAGSRGLGDSEPGLPLPGWWDGDCDTNCFFRETGYGAYPLGAVYRGMKACGPRPSAHPYVQTVVDFGVGQPQLEWQCPELSKRYLYLAYDIEPYPGNGNDMVTGYPGDLLNKVWNCTIGQPPQPGDVLSYGAYSQWGHTSVVVASDVDGTGNGTIEVIEQNSSADGRATHAVSGWCVNAYTDVIGWLHFPDWEVTYYADESLQSACSSDVAVETYLFYEWGANGPAEGCPAEGFSARFSRSLQFPGGEYTFTLGYEHGARLKIDGSIIIDGWSGSGEHYAAVDLSPGRHQIEVELRHGAGDAALSAFWWGPGFELSRDTQDASWWYAEYWPNQTLWWDPVATVHGGDGALDHQWTNGPPTAGLPVDHFSSRFRRTVSFDAGQWEFTVFSDDGVRFWVDDVLVLDEWQDQVALFTPTVSLTPGDYELRIEHYENLEWAKVGVSWDQVSDAPTPAGWVTAPISGTVIETCPINVEVEVEPGLGPVEHVELYAYYRGTWHHLGDDHTLPFTIRWDCGPVADRRADLLVHVWDGSGREFVDLSGAVSVEFAHRERFHLPLILRARDTRFRDHPPASQLVPSEG